MARATEGRCKSILDTSVLINFLKIDRCDLLGSHPRYSFLVPDEVADEVTADFPDQRACLAAALEAGHLERTTVTSVSELETAARLKAVKVGVGESAAIAAAICRGLPVALQDDRATKKGRKISSSLVAVTTETIMVDLIIAGTMTVAEADGLKARWTTLRFKIKAKSFGELLPDERRPE